MDRLVSVVLCTYNGERFLREQLESIYNQSYGNLEMVVRDDCSTDGTVKILEEYGKTRGLLYSVNKGRLGFVKNFEKAMSSARGDYLALSDQDDVWLPEKIETLVRKIGPSTLICSDAELMDAQGRKIHNSYRRYSGLQRSSKYTFESLLFHNFVQGATSLFKRDLLKAALPMPRNVTVHDWWLALIASRGAGIRYLADRLVRYRIHGQNNTEVLDARSLGPVLMRYMKRDRRAYRKWIRGQIAQLLAVERHPLFRKDRRMVQKALAYHRDLLLPPPTSGPFPWASGIGTRSIHP